MVSFLGIAINWVKKDRAKEIIPKVQRELFSVSAELATKSEDYEKFTSKFKPITDEMASELEELIDEIEAVMDIPKAFIIPGSNLASASLDVSRAIVRRAERRVVALKEKGGIRNEAILRYLRPSVCPGKI